MVVGGQLHALAALSLGKEHPVPIGYVHSEYYKLILSFLMYKKYSI
jgi:hypothetical protein